MELDTAAWERWKAYRIAIKKAIKSVSEEAAKLKLMRFGDDQAEVVEQSIAGGYQGLFELRKAKTDPHAPKTRTKAQQEADNVNWDYLNRQSEKAWDERLRTNPLAKLQLCAALLARMDTEADQSSVLLAERRTWLRDRSAQLLREADAAAVLADYHVSQYVLRVFNAQGLRRLEARASGRRAA